MERQKLKTLLDEKYELYNNAAFIKDDPISIPHSFTELQDIEISGFLAAIMAWGQRKTILNKCKQLLQWMDNSPYDFIVNHSETDLKPFVNFSHRTFQADDILYFIFFFKQYYSENTSLEDAFSKFLSPEDETVENGLIGFRNLFFSFNGHMKRTEKHIASPERNSSCKRLNMFLRWMVRKDIRGVDFGLWNTISPSQLVCPLDVHVERVARRLGLLNRKQTDWKAVIELTANLRKLDPADPVKYDFALFGMGVME